MARLRDVVPVVRKIGIFSFAMRLWRQIGNNNLLTWASALAYAWLFAIFPFVLFLLTLIPYLPEQWKRYSKHQLAVAVYQLPKQGADTVWINIEPHINRLLNSKVGSISIIGVLLTLWAASGGVNATMAALNQVYRVTKSRPFYKQRPLAVGITLTEILLILIVLVLIPLGTIATRWAVKHVPETAVKYLPLLAVWEVVRYALGVALLLTAVALIYHFGPNIRQPWRWLTPGSVFCVGVWLLLGVLFRVYIDKYGKYDQTYGTVGGVVIILFFFYIDAVVLLVGAQINSEIDFIALNLEPGATNFKGKPWAA